MGHDDDRDLAGVEAALAQLGRQRPRRARGPASRGGSAAPPKFSFGVGGDRGVKAGVDEDRAGARVADQEDAGIGTATASLPVSSGAQELRGHEATARALDPHPGQAAPPGHDRLDRDRRPWRASGKRLVQRFCLHLHLHRRRTLPGGRAAYRLAGDGWRGLDSRIFRAGLLEGQVCVVSGSGSGLGRETALELAAARRRSSSAAAAARSRSPRRRARRRSCPAPSSPRRWTSATRRRSSGCSTACSSATAASTSSSTTPAASSSAPPRRSRRRASGR